MVFIDLAHRPQWIKLSLGFLVENFYPILTSDNNVIGIRFCGQSGYTSKSNNLSGFTKFIILKVS